MTRTINSAMIPKALTVAFLAVYRPLAISSKGTTATTFQPDTGEVLVETSISFPSYCSVSTLPSSGISMLPRGVSASFNPRQSLLAW
ncbi:hypothetical protein D3C81_2112980 [compost metagenome]